jgi:transposase
MVRPHCLNTLDGTVLSQCRDRHTNEDWIPFLGQIDRHTPKGKQVHIIADNYAAHKHPNVQRWLTRHKRFQMHYPPTSASWLNMVERFFRDITQQRIRRGVFHSVAELITAIKDYVENNRQPKPFIWTAKACDILQNVTRAKRALNKIASRSFDPSFTHEAESRPLHDFRFAGETIRTEEDGRAESRSKTRRRYSFPPVCIPKLSNISAAVRNRITWLFWRTARVARKIGTRRSCPNGTPKSGWPMSLS